MCVWLCATARRSWPCAAHAGSRRSVYVWDRLRADGKLVLLSDAQGTRDALQSLEVPLHLLGPGRYFLPLFSAPYWDVAFPLWVEDARPHPARLTIRFCQGGGAAFRVHVQRAREAWDVERHTMDALRTLFDANTAAYEAGGGGIDVPSTAPPTYEDALGMGGGRG